MGKLIKGLVKFTVAAAAVGGVAYAFRDKIKETEVYKNNNVDEKIEKVKATLKEKMPKVFDKEADIIDEDEIFAEDAEDVADRDYVSIDADATEDATEDAEPAEA